MVYSLGTLRLEHNNNLSDNAIEPAVGIDAGVLWHWEQMTAHLKLTSSKFANGQYRGKLQYDHNFVLSRHKAIKLMVSREKISGFLSSEVNVALRYHF